MWCTAIPAVGARARSTLARGDRWCLPRRRWTKGQPAGGGGLHAHDDLRGPVAVVEHHLRWPGSASVREIDKMGERARAGHQIDEPLQHDLPGQRPRNGGRGRGDRVRLRRGRGGVGRGCSHRGGCGSRIENQNATADHDDRGGNGRSRYPIPAPVPVCTGPLDRRSTRRGGGIRGVPVMFGGAHDHHPFRTRNLGARRAAHMVSHTGASHRDVAHGDPWVPPVVGHSYLRGGRCVEVLRPSGGRVGRLTPGVITAPPPPQTAHPPERTGVWPLPMRR